MRGWVSRSSPRDILNCDIFFDGVGVHGDRELVRRLHGDAVEMARGSRTFLALLALNAGDFHVPKGLFGRLKLSDGRIDLKAGGIMPIFSAARMVALKHGLSARATPARLDGARALDASLARTVDDLKEAHRILLGLILGQQVRDIDQGVPPSNRVAVAELSGFEKEELTWALDRLPSVADLLGTPPLS